MNTDFIITGKRLNEEYARSEGRRQARATWRFSLALSTLFAAAVVIGAVLPAMPRVIDLLMAVPQ